MKHIILDMHGIIFCHDPGFDIQESSSRFVVEAWKYAKKYPKYESAVVDDNIKLLLEIESDSIKKGLTDSSHLQIYYYAEAIELKDKLFNSENKIIVAANSRIETSKNVLEKFFKNYDVDFSLDDIDFFDVTDYGSKSDPDSWSAVYKYYDQIDMIFEDKEKNLEAAQKAAKALGYNPIVSPKLKFV